MAMSEQRHIIKRQLIELHVDPRQTVSAAQMLQTEMSRIYRQRIVPLIDQVCSELSEPDRIYRLDALEIDLGIVNPDNLEAEVVSKVRAQLRQALAAEISRQEQTVEPQTQTPQTRSQLELLAVFARTGSLPWWADTSQPDVLTACLQHLLQTAPDALRRLMRALVQEQRPLHRLILSYPDTYLTQLLYLLLPAHPYDPQAFIQLLASSQITAAKSAAQIRRMAWTSLLSVAALAQPGWTDVVFYTAVTNQIARALTTTPYEFLAAIYKLTQEEKPTADLAALVQTLYQQAAENLPSSPLPSISPDTFTAETPELAIPHQAMNSPDTFTTETPESAIPQQAAQQTTADQQPDTAEDLSAFSLQGVEELYVANAGLVILWPFLSHFFARLGLLQERQFKDPQSQQRAVGLLQYMVTDEMIFPEYALPLNKLLCGLPLTAVFNLNAPFSPTETEECTDLLQATITQAPILRQMSVDGFRGTFLRRQGVLRSRDGAWLLQVEKETYDVVLERFPWGWEWVKLPWMETPLRVEWL